MSYCSYFFAKYFFSIMSNLYLLSLKKDHQSRPKYPELLEQSFIKIYEKKFVDVAAWFQSVLERTGKVPPQRR